MTPTKYTFPGVELRREKKTIRARNLFTLGLCSFEPICTLAFGGGAKYTHLKARSRNTKTRKYKDGDIYQTLFYL